MSSPISPASARCSAADCLRRPTAGARCTCARWRPRPGVPGGHALRQSTGDGGRCRDARCPRRARVPGSTPSGGPHARQRFSRRSARRPAFRSSSTGLERCSRRSSPTEPITDYESARPRRSVHLCALLPRHARERGVPRAVRLRGGIHVSGAWRGRARPVEGGSGGVRGPPAGRRDVACRSWP